MKVFRIPKVSGGKPTNHKIVGIIDASGSMSSHWAHVAKFWNEYIPADNALTITFDTKTRICESNRLETNINKHGGGGTNITEAFKVFEEKLGTFKKDTSITVIFISDGQDNNLHTLEQRCQALKGNQFGFYINFLCLGVESGFPTFLSMKLREKYHSGDVTIPAIFLIEYSSEKAFFNKFESMKPYFNSAVSVTVEPPVIQYPWEKPKNNLYEGVWICTDSSMLEIEGNIYDLSKDAINLEGVVEIFKGWTQVIHLESLKPGAKVKNIAIETKAWMEKILDQVKKERGIDILNSKEVDDAPEGLTFHQRALRNLVKHTLSRAAWFYEEIKLLAEGKSPKELSEYDAAKRIGIGTIVGKYHQKALALKGITVDEFKKLRDEFASIYKEITIKPNSNQEGSVITLQNQKEVLLEKDFLDGLSYCNSQFDLVEAFPLIGMAIKIKRFNGSMLNPWLTKVRFIAKHHKSVDTISIIKNNNNLELKTGENSVETINAVLPLFDNEDADLAPLLQTRLYHLMMTFNVMQNVDTLYEDAYLALLSNTLLYLLKEPDTEWKRGILDLIDKTVRIVYYDHPDFKKYREEILKDPINGISNDEEQKKYGSIDLSKAILHTFMLWRDKLIDEKRTQHLIDCIIGFYFYNLVKNNDFELAKYFKCKIQSQAGEQAMNTVRNNFKNCKTLGDLRREVYAAFDKLMTGSEQYEFVWDVSDLYKLDTKVRVDLFEQLSEMLIGKAPNKDVYIANIARAYSSGTYAQMMSDEMMKKDLNELTGSLGKKLTIDTQKGGVKQLPACKSAVFTLTKEFQEWFKKIHFEIMPISKAELKKYCEDNKIPLNTYTHLPDSYLLKNACLAKDCPHYMKVNNRLHHHMDVWNQGLPPAFHRTVKANYKKDTKEIYQLFMSGACIKKNKQNFEYKVEKYERSEAEVLAYIEKLKEAYSKMD